MSPYGLGEDLVDCEEELRALKASMVEGGVREAHAGSQLAPSSPAPSVPDALRALSEAATPGEWTREEEWRVTATGGAFYIPSAGPNRRRWMTSVASDSPHADAALIVAAVNDLRARLEGADTEYHEHVAGDKHSHAFNGPHSHGGVSALRFPRADTGGGIDVERLDAALGSLDESNITYEHGYSASGEPRDPDLFVEYEALRRAVARLRRG